MTITIKHPVLNIGKSMIFILLIYITWYKEVFGDRPVILYGCTFLATAVAFIVCLQERDTLSGMPSILTAFVILAVYSAATCWIVAADLSVALSALFTFIAFTVVCFDIWIFSKPLGQMDWILTILFICGIVCAVQTIFFGSAYYNGIIVHTMSKQNNPNTLGLVMVSALLSLIIRPKVMSKRFLSSVFWIFVFFYVIILSGSRKSFFAAVFLLVLFVLVYLKEISHNYTARVIGRMLLLILASAATLYYLWNYLEDTSLFWRLDHFTERGANQIRVNMYKDAIRFWKTSPLIGIGFGQYRVLSPYRSYSHSTYAETLSCLGLVGVVILLVPFAMLIRQLISGRNAVMDDHERKYQHAILCGALASELFLGVGQIFMYSLMHMIVLLYIFYQTRSVTTQT